MDTFSRNLASTLCERIWQLYKFVSRLCKFYAHSTSTLGLLNPYKNAYFCTSGNPRIMKIIDTHAASCASETDNNRGLNSFNPPMQKSLEEKKRSLCEKNYRGKTISDAQLDICGIISGFRSRQQPSLKIPVRWCHDVQIREWDCAKISRHCRNNLSRTIFNKYTSFILIRELIILLRMNWK